MHLRRVASFVLGAWIIGSVFAIYIASQSGTTADRVMHLPPPQVNKMIQVLGEDQARLLLRYHAAEQDRRYIADWGRLQLLLGPLLLLLLAGSTRNNRLTLALCGAMFVFAVFAHFVLAPEIDYLSRGLIFSSGWSANRARYLALRGTFNGLEVLKLVLGFVLAGYLFVYRVRRVPAATEDGETAAIHSQTAGS